jgi:isopentenyldiphosphate isomerase
MSEYLDVVDEDDNVIGKETRGDCHAKGKIHRGIHVLVFNSKGEILLGKRSMKKKQYKGLYQDIGGHVEAGESYEEAARRELEEETGITCEPEKIRDIKKRYKKDNENIRLFRCLHDGPLKLNIDEFTSAEFIPVDRIESIVKNRKSTLTPGTVLSLSSFLENR